MRLFLGIDGGGTKTAFVLLDESGRVRARQVGGSAYHPEVGVAAVRALLADGIQDMLQQAGVGPEAISFAFFGIPCYGEDSRLLPVLDALPHGLLPEGRWRCGNDVVCGWAGALAGAEGINVVAGTGSIAYGEWRGRQARSGGWGELFSDEGSAYWIAREGLAAFSRMSDGRLPRSLLYDRIRAQLQLAADLDLCAVIYGDARGARSAIARLAPLISDCAHAGDSIASEVLAAAGRELAALVRAVHAQLEVDAESAVPVSWSGSLFEVPPLLAGFRDSLGTLPHWDLRAPRLPPDAGAALQAARLHGTPLSEAAVAALGTSAP